MWTHLYFICYSNVHYESFPRFGSGPPDQPTDWLTGWLPVSHCHRRSSRASERAEGRRRFTFPWMSWRRRRSVEQNFGEVSWLFSATFKGAEPKNTLYVWKRGARDGGVGSGIWWSRVAKVVAVGEGEGSTGKLFLKCIQTLWRVYFVVHRTVDNQWKLFVAEFKFRKKELTEITRGMTEVEMEMETVGMENNFVTL